MVSLSFGADVVNDVINDAMNFFNLYGIIQDALKFSCMNSCMISRGNLPSNGVKGKASKRQYTADTNRRLPFDLDKAK